MTMIRQRPALFYSDDIVQIKLVSTSGVGTQSRWLINGLLSTGNWSFKCFGGAVKHDSYETVTVNPDFVIKPTNGYGDKNLLRQVLIQEKPDVLLLFTDPRFFLFVWEMRDEIAQICPIAYNHLWDNYPWPEFNRVLYESTDLLNCINWPTYEMLKERFPEKTNYIPHAVPKDLFFPLPESTCKQIKRNVLGEERLDHFIVTFVSRNARRKMSSDVIVSFQQFLEKLEKSEGHKKATLMMHTDPLDPEGANLHHVVEMLNVKDNVVFSKDRIGFNDMNSLYNITDVLVNRSLAEGFGLSVLEAKMVGKPVIATKTGGMTRQVEDHETGEHYGVALEPEVKTLVGNQLVPFIYEDLVSHDAVTFALCEVYSWGPEKRKEVGLRSMKHAHKNYDMNNMITQWDKSLTALVKNWKNDKKWSIKEL